MKWPSGSQWNLRVSLVVGLGGLLALVNLASAQAWSAMRMPVLARRTVAVSTDFTKLVAARKQQDQSDKRTNGAQRRLSGNRAWLWGYHRAFTLIELLVVVATICVLASLATPVLTKAVSSGRNLVCANNLRQLQCGWQQYADDNGDRLVHNVAAQELGDLISRSFPGSWVTGAAKTDLNSHNLQAGSLFSFVNSCAVYHCPADRSTVMDHASTLRFRSYSLSGSLGGIAMFHPVTSASELDKSGRANVFAFLDENERSIDDGLFGLGAKPDHNWLNLPSTRHGRWTNLSFTDGHVTSIKWKAPKFFVWYNQPAASGEDLQDLRDLQRGLPLP